MTPRDKIKEKFVQIIGKTNITSGHDRCLPPNYYYEPVVDMLSAEDIDNIAEAILNALPIEWADSKSEVQSEDIILADMRVGKDEDAHLDPFKVTSQGKGLIHCVSYNEGQQAFDVRRFEKIIHRNNKPVINVDEVL